MRGRAGVVVLMVGVFAAGLAVAAIQSGTAAPPPPATTVEPTVQVSTVTPTTTTTTTAATTTAAGPPANATIVAPVTRPVGGGCLLVGGFALLEPGRAPLVLGPVAALPRAEDAGSGSIAYPADGSVVTASAINLQTSGCGNVHAANGYAGVRTVSLFGGAITARSVELGVRANKVTEGGAIAALTVAGTRVAIRPGRRVPVQDWGYAVAHDAAVDPLTAAALSVHLTAAHAGLPAGTVLLVSFASLPRETATPAPAKIASPPRHVVRSHAPARTRTVVRHPERAKAKARARVHKRRRRHARKRHAGEPLKLTPPLGADRYVFPVVGESDYIDTYGAFRGDVPGNWHHGDDIFAAVGTPVLAVADGTLNRVGWQRLGGWRLWVRDRHRNEFYYAHLSGYSPLALHSKRVRAGDVIGFIGNTGDAFTTSPHLHFEIHPVSLLHLKYNGAVDPTTYLDAWHRIEAVHTPRPVHPRFPKGAVRPEARYVWRQLLAARGLISHAPKLSERPRIRVPRTDNAFGSPALPRHLTAAGRANVVPRAHDRWLGLLPPLITLLGTGALMGVALAFHQRTRRAGSDP